jgi:hypothetical protein
MMEQERFNHLTARFLRLNDAGKAHITSVTRQLTDLCTPSKPVSRPYAAGDAVTQCDALARGPAVESGNPEIVDREA